MTAELRAFRTTLWSIDSLVLAKSRAAARYATIRSAREAGYPCAFTERIRVRRSPYHDEMDAREGQCRFEQDVDRELKERREKRMALVLARADELLAKGCPCGLCKTKAAGAAKEI